MVQNELRKRTHCFCWWKVPSVNVHDPNGCDECKRRFKILCNEKDEMYDIQYLVYKKDGDKELQETLSTLEKYEEIRKAEEDKWYCRECDVRCFTRNILMGRNIENINRKKTKSC